MKENATNAELFKIGKLPKYVNSLVFSAYIAVIAIVMCFHEPWFDEAQSWLIARDSSFADLFLLRPHYEGHPPFWTLLLSIPAKTGVPYEIGIKSVQILCSAFFVGWLIFKSPLNRVATLLLPFTYFACFQYGVTARPYALLCAGLLITASYWKERNFKPWKLTVSLGFLCLTSAYGIALAAGFALAWVIDVALKNGSQKAVSEIIYNKQRLICWVTLTFVGILSIAVIWPASDAFATRPTYDGNSQIIQWLSFLFVVPSESAFTSFASDVSLRRLPLDLIPTIICVVVSLIMWAAIIQVSRRRKTLIATVIPYLALSVAAAKYFTLHHAGIVFVFFISQIWICAERKNFDFDDVPEFIKNIFNKTNKLSESFTRILPIALVVILLFPSLIWNVFACVNDIRFDYSGSREIANYIAKNKVSNRRWMGSWFHTKQITDSTGEEIAPETNDLRQYSWQLVIANPYFSRNLVSCNYKNSSFITNELPTYEQAEDEIMACATKKESDYFVTDSKEPWYYFLALNYNIAHYNKADIVKVKTAWKSRLIQNDITIYKRGNSKNFVS